MLTVGVACGHTRPRVRRTIVYVDVPEGPRPEVPEVGASEDQWKAYQRVFAGLKRQAWKATQAWLASKLNLELSESAKRHLACVACVVLAVIMAFALDFAMSTPTVHRSWSTKRCIEVMPPTAGTCDDLPDRYDVVWMR